MKGFVPTPEPLVAHMVEELFKRRPPRREDLVVDPGCGDGRFLRFVSTYCRQGGYPVPKLVGVELDPGRAAMARQRLADLDAQIVESDFLAADLPTADYVIGNPPYVAITGIDEGDRVKYRRHFKTATGRFDLYSLFFEKSLAILAKSGRLVFVTPEKFVYVDSARELRRQLLSQTVAKIQFVDEKTFAGRTTYPVITTVDGTAISKPSTEVVGRDGAARRVVLPRDGSSWNPVVNGAPPKPLGLHTLGEVATRVSCGVATGADGIFVMNRAMADASGVGEFAYSTVSGKQLGMTGLTDGTSLVSTRDVMLVPYDSEGRLLPETELGPLADFLKVGGHESKLKARTCVAKGNRPWYRFHDNVPLPDILQPKILCKDIAPEPRFWLDLDGTVVPRHSVYYIVPRKGIDLLALADYLNSSTATTWLKAHCQRAANGFYRLQSKVIRNLPVPAVQVRSQRPASRDELSPRPAIARQAVLQELRQS